jgi:hypothetical protein
LRRESCFSPWSRCKYNEGVLGLGVVGSSPCGGTNLLGESMSDFFPSSFQLIGYVMHRATLSHVSCERVIFVIFRTLESLQINQHPQISSPRRPTSEMSPSSKARLMEVDRGNDQLAAGNSRRPGAEGKRKDRFGTCRF